MIPLPINMVPHNKIMLVEEKDRHIKTARQKDIDREIEKGIETERERERP